MKFSTDILHSHNSVRVQLGEVRFSDRQRVLDLPSLTPSLLLILAACSGNPNSYKTRPDDKDDDNNNGGVTATDIDEPPSGLVLSCSSQTLAEDAGATKLAEVTITDDVLGVNTISLSDDTRFVIKEKSSPERLVKELWLKAAFHEAVEDYLELCEAQGRSPDIPFKGSFNIRPGRTLHQRAALIARQRGLALNALVTEALTDYLNRQEK